MNSSSHQKLVSIIVPVYNTAKYLPSCIESIISQTYQNLEIILIDDGSTDDSAQIIQQYAKKDSRIKAIHQKNQGQSAARNHGIQISTGDYISFIDSDDQVAGNFISELIHPYTDQNTSITVCGYKYNILRTHSVKNIHTSPLKPRSAHQSQKAFILSSLAKDGRMYSCTNKLFRASIIHTKNLLFDTRLNFAEDTKFVLDYLQYASGEISFVLKPLYIYNFGTETSTVRSTSTNWKNWQTSYQNLKHWLGKPQNFSELFWLKVVHLRWRISYIRSKRRAK